MKWRECRIALAVRVAAAITILWAAPADGQDRLVQPTRARGFVADGVYTVQGLDAINNFNGALTVSVPLREYRVGDGLAYSFGLKYGSDVWDHFEVCTVNVAQYVPAVLDDIGPGNCNDVASIPADDANAGMGWRFGFGSMRGSRGTERTIYVDEEGGRHMFYGDRTSLTDPGAVSYTVDGTHLRKRVIDAVTQVVDMPDGTSKKFVCEEPCSDYWSAEWRLVEWTDSTGNGLTFQYALEPGVPAHEVWTITERPFGAVPGEPQRSHVARFERIDLRPFRRRLKELDLAGPEGRRAVYRFSYADELVFRDLDHRALGHPEVERLSPTVTADGRIRIPQLRGVSLHEGGEELVAWSFKYYDDATTPASEIYAAGAYRQSDLMGRLRRVVLPTKGEIEYTYGSYVFPRRSCDIGGAPLRAQGVAVVRGVRTKQIYKKGGIEREGRPWIFMSVANRTALDPGEVCSGFANSVSTAVLDPRGGLTASYFSIYRNTTPSGRWMVQEYGMPFDHDQSDAGVPGALAGSRSVSRKVFDCSAVLPAFDAAVGQPLGLRNMVRGVLGLIPGQEPACGAPKRTTFVAYEYEDAGCSPAEDSSCFMINRRQKSERMVFGDDVVGGAPVSASMDNEDYDGYGNYRRQIRDGNFGVATYPAQSPSDRVVTYTGYNDVSGGNPEGSATAALIQQRWILNTYSRREVTITADPQAPPAVARTAKTLYSWDPGNGRLRAQRVLNGDVPTGGDVLTVIDRESGQGEMAGAVVRTTTTYGGDGGGLSTSLPGLFAPPGAPPAGSAFRMVEWVRHGGTERAEYQTLAGARVLQVEDNTIDPWTGLIVKSRDAAGVETALRYDLLGRIAAVEPRDDAPTTYAYRAATAGQYAGVEVRQAPGGIEQSFLYDGQGRLCVAKERIPGAGIRKVVTEYLPTGEKAWVSVPVRDVPGSDPLLGVTNRTSYVYDYLGRVAKSTGPDGSKTTVEYDGDRATRTKLWNVSGRSTWKTEGRDQLGRTVRVAEDSVRVEGAPPGVVDNSTAVTRYAYDVRGNVVLVKQGVQKRSFVYDARGFLVSRQEPELGIGGNGTITYSEFDSMGHARRRPSGTGARDTLTFDHDRAGRLTAVRLEPPGASAVPLKEFSYYDSNCGPGSWAAGKLRAATRHNYIPNPVLPAVPGQPRSTIDVVVSETYSYEGPEGRVSRRRTDVSYGGASHAFDLGLDYDAFGNLAGTSYPRCVIGCGGVTGPDRTVRTRYEQGILTEIPGFASISYHANGMVQSITHANGVTDEQTKDPHGRLRPARLRTRGALVASGQAGGDWDSGPYAYDGVGNITAIGADQYAYDAVSRLVDAKVAGRRQKFAYDEYANLHTIARYESTAESAPVSATILMKTEPGSNHLTPPAGSAVPRYDKDGNLAEWRDPLQPASEASFKYVYDPFNMMAELRGGPGLGKVFIYTADDERLATIDYKAGGTSRPGLIRETWTLRGTRNLALRDFTFGSDSGWAFARDYVHREGQLLASVDPSTVVRHFHLDHLGTARLVTDGGGRSAGRPTYLPFGEELSSVQGGDRLRFTAHERDVHAAGTGPSAGDLDYMHARYYSSRLARFLSVDPASSTPAQPQGWNRYAYTAGNPVTYLDPNGRERAWTREERDLYSSPEFRQMIAAIPSKERGPAELYRAAVTEASINHLSVGLINVLAARRTFGGTLVGGKLSPRVVALLAALGKGLRAAGSAEGDSAERARAGLEAFAASAAGASWATFFKGADGSATYAGTFLGSLFGLPTENGLLLGGIIDENQALEEFDAREEEARKEDERRRAETQPAPQVPQ